MWSCPYNFNHHANWLGVGLTQVGTVSHSDWFDQMYNKQFISTMNYKTADYYGGTTTISAKDTKFEITGTMGTSHKAKARIIVRPLELDDLAGPLKDKIEHAITPVGK